MVKAVQRIFLISPLVVLISAFSALALAPRALRVAYARTPPEELPECPAPPCPAPCTPPLHILSYLILFPLHPTHWPA